ncbi:hypothetical protein FBR01_20030 [Anaerolineae bacterium CFX8]|nr:hypothetical protein [Anaerolineae bacterium CFX8]
MSVRNVPMLICDGCGSVIDMDFYIRIRPTRQTVVQKDPCTSPERDFCCEACAAWWHAQFPESGPWGPAWDEREWWCEQVGDCGERARVRTTHDEMPLVDVRAHFEDPESL